MRIAFNKGSYVPVIVNIHSPLPDLPADARRQLFLAMTSLDVGLNEPNIVEYIWPALTHDPYHPRLLAAVALFRVATRTVRAITQERYALIELILQRIAAQGLTTLPWEYYFTQGCIKAGRDHDWKAATDLFNRSIQESHGEALFYWWPTALAASQGYIDEAISILQAAVEHFARSHVNARLDLAVLLILAKRFKEAEELLNSTRTLVRLGPDHHLDLYFVFLYEAQDRFAEAREAIVRWQEKPVVGASRIHPDVILFGGMTELVLGRLGDKDQARHFFYLSQTQKMDLYNGEAMPASALAIAAIGADRLDEAEQWLDYAAFGEHDPLSMWFHLFPPFRHLHSSPGYRRLLKQLKLALPNAR